VRSIRFAIVACFSTLRFLNLFSLGVAFAVHIDLAYGDSFQIP
jgi:hypothetical protein